MFIQVNVGFPFPETIRLTHRVTNRQWWHQVCVLIIILVLHKLRLFIRVYSFIEPSPKTSTTNKRTFLFAYVGTIFNKS